MRHLIPERRIGCEPPEMGAFRYGVPPGSVADRPVYAFIDALAQVFARFEVRHMLA